MGNQNRRFPRRPIGPILLPFPRMPEEWPFGDGTGDLTWAGFIGATLTLIVAIGGSMLWVRRRAKNKR